MKDHRVDRRDVMSTIASAPFLGKDQGRVEIFQAVCFVHEVLHTREPASRDSDNIQKAQVVSKDGGRRLPHRPLLICNSRRR